MDRLFVHIGMHKTGSSSIQESLATGLTDPEFDYLNFGHPNGSLAVIQAFDDRFELRPAVRNRNITPEQREEIRARGMERIKAAFDSSTHKNAVVSAEDIRGLSLDALKEMFTFCRQYTENIDVVSYIREPRGLVESSIQQRLKIAAVSLEVPQRINYVAHYQKFDDIVGRDRNHLWLFEPSNFANGDIVMDFCDRLGIKFDPAKVIFSNDGLSLEAVRMLWCYRKHFPAYHKDDRHMVNRLSRLKGEKLSFGPKVLEIFSGGSNSANVQAIEERMQASFKANGFEEKPGNVQSLEDLESLSAAGRAWLAQEADISTDLLMDTKGVAEAVRSLARA